MIERDDSRFRSQVWQSHKVGDQFADPSEIPLLRDLIQSFSRDRWVFVERGPPIPSGRAGGDKRRGMEEALSFWPN